MTTTTLSGFNLTYDENDNPIFQGAMSVDFIYDEDLKLSYSVVEDGRRGILNQPEVDLNFTDGYLSFSKGPFDGQIHAFKLVFTDGSTASVLSIADIYLEQDYVFLVDSSPGFVVPTDQASVNDLYSKIQLVELPTGQFAPDTEFSFSDIPAGTSVENDVFEGTDGDDVINSGSGDDVIYGRDGNDTLYGGAGDDTLDGGAGDDSLFGGAGIDDLIGGSGDDYINPGDNTYYDYIEGGAGSDTIDLADIQTGYVHLSYAKLPSGIVVDVDGIDLIGDITKQTIGSDTINAIENALSAGGLGLVGTTSNDQFNVFVADDQWMQIRAGDGVDAYSLGGDGKIRLDLQDGREGIHVDLTMRSIYNDGFGNSETYTGDFAEVRGTHHDDVIIGSSTKNYEYFVLGGGNDTLDGSGLFDTVSYSNSSSNIENLKVDLALGLATGTWDGITFKHQLANIEEVFGSANDDFIIGSNNADFLDSRAGNDTLTGGEGSDIFTFRGTFDHDVITDFDASEDSLVFYAEDGTSIAISELIESTESSGSRVLSTSDGLSSVTFGTTIMPPAVNPAFDIALASTSGNLATFEIYADASVDPDNDGIGSFEFTLSHDASDLLIDMDSFASASGISGVPNYDATTGTLEAAAFAFPNFTDLTAPIVTFSATILDTDNPLNLSLTKAIVDRVAQDDVVETFDFSSVSLTVTTVDRFGNSLTPDEVVAYELTSGEQIYVREVGDSEDTAVFEIVANPTSKFSALDFDLTDYAGLTDFTLSDALASWTSQTNTTVPNQVAFSGFSNDLEIAAGQEIVLATFTSAADPDFDISGIELDGASQPDVSVGEIPATSTNGNVTIFETANNSDTYVFADKAIDEASEDAIGAFDALQALRLAVGLTKSDGTAEWHDYLAADINKDGRVGADDALDILKFAVGLTDGAPADWIFVDGDADWSGVNRSNTSYDEGVMLEDVLVDTSINMTGILVGDLDGSYVA